MQQEWVHIFAHVGNDERHGARHKSGDECHVAAEPVELGNRDRALLALRPRQCGDKLRAAIKRVRTLAGFDLDELGNDREAVRRTERDDCGPLRIEAESRPPLLLCRDAEVGDNRLHGTSSKATYDL